MPTAKAISGIIFYRSVSDKNGLDEISKEFSSLDDLFQLVLDAQPPYLVDRISLTGIDAQSTKRIITFVFQSLQITEAK